jgi:hypothetical protein
MEIQLSNISDVQAVQKVTDSIASAGWLISIVMAVFLGIWFLRRRYNNKHAQPKHPSISRTAFTSTHFGVVYDDGKDCAGHLRYALICNGQGEELCRYEEADGQTIRGFSSENGLLYMHTTEIDEDGLQVSAKWLFIPEDNELVECD